MKILIAIDKFKGSLTSLEAAQAIMRGIEASTHANGGAALRGVAPGGAAEGNSYEIVEIADGGDGSANVLLSVKNGVKVVPVEGVNPLGQKIESSYLAYYEPCDSAADSANSGVGSGAAFAAADSAAGSGATFAAADSAAGSGATFAADSVAGSGVASAAADSAAGFGATFAAADSAAGSGATSAAADSAAGSGATSAAADSAAGAGVLKKCAFIEMAKISGLELIPPVDSNGRKLRNPLITTTYGLGQLIHKAYEDGARKITLSIGGSATNDGGTGMLQALGFKFYRKTSSPETSSPETNSPEASPLIAGYMCGGLLSEIGRIDAPSDGLFGRSCEIEVICDVTNPLLGENGATYVYGPQKGANLVMLKQLEAGMENLVRVAGGTANVADHLLPGAGAAGGVGYAVNHFLGGKIISGWRFFANLTNLKQKIAEADLVITGEGRIDSQSFNGKVIDGVTTLAKEAGKPVWLFCGINSSGQTADFITAADSIVATESTPKSGHPIFQLSSLEPDREKSMKNAAHLLERLAREAAASHLPIF